MGAGASCCIYLAVASACFADKRKITFKILGLTPDQQVRYLRYHAFPVQFEFIELITHGILQPERLLGRATNGQVF